MAPDSDVDEEDYSDLQEQLRQKLDSLLDDQIDEKVQKKAKIKKTKKHSKEIRTSNDQLKEAHESRKSSDENHVHRLNKGKSSTSIVGRIRDLTSAAVREKQRGTAKKLSDQRNLIKDKVEKLLDSNRKQTPLKSGGDHTDSDSNSDECDEDHGDGHSDSRRAEDDFSSDDTDFSDFDDEGEAPGKIPSGKNKQIEKFKTALGITDADLLQVKRDRERQEKQKDSQVESIGLLMSKKRRAPPEIVVYEGHSKAGNKKAKKDAKSAKVPENSISPANEFDLHQARFDVRKFGIDSMTKKQKKKGMTDLLISLGAKAPKNQPLNYKDFQRKRANDREQAANKRIIDRKMGWKVSSQQKKRSKRDRNDIGPVDGQIGSYRGGVQVVNQKARDRVTGSRGRKR